MTVGEALSRLCPWRRPVSKAHREMQHALLAAEATCDLHRRDVEVLHRVLDKELQIITGHHR